jgi:hypothetical protein
LYLLHHTIAHFECFSHNRSQTEKDTLLVTYTSQRLKKSVDIIHIKEELTKAHTKKNGLKISCLLLKEIKPKLIVDDDPEKSIPRRVWLQQESIPGLG